jgi:hypothetical protein
MLPQPTVETLFPALPPEAQDNTSAISPQLASVRFLKWRQSQAPLIIKALQLDEERMITWRQQLMASVDEQGRVEEINDLAATALTALALQAWPADQDTITTILRCQAWLGKNTKGMVRKDAQTIALVACALADWNGLPPQLYGEIEIALIDGKATPWQIWFLSLYGSSNQQRELAALRKGADHQVWLSYLKLIDPANITALPFQQIAPLTLTLGESRMAWAFCSWSIPGDSSRFETTLRTWSQQDPLQIQASLSGNVGKNAATAVALLTVSAPWRLPATWLPTITP